MVLNFAILLFLVCSSYHPSDGVSVCEKPKDCSEVQRQNKNAASGVYTIYPQDGREPRKVYCDMDTDCGGWTVIQRRKDGSVNFKRGWSDYQYGFGNVNGEFWLGNEAIHSLTNLARTELRIELEDFAHGARFALYDNFSVADADSKYRLTVGGYYGNAGDAMKEHNKQNFSTIDQDNDVYDGSCAQQFNGAWWYSACLNANLNGLYLRGKHNSYADGVDWLLWTGDHYSLKTTVMMIRRK